MEGVVEPKRVKLSEPSGECANASVAASMHGGADIIGVEKLDAVVGEELSTELSEKERPRSEPIAESVPKAEQMGESGQESRAESESAPESSAVTEITTVSSASSESTQETNPVVESSNVEESEKEKDQPASEEKPNEAVSDEEKIGEEDELDKELSKASEEVESSEYEDFSGSSDEILEHIRRSVEGDNPLPDLHTQLKKVEKIIRRQTMKVRAATLESPQTLQEVAELIRDKKVTNIIIMTGAGISVAAGIPDFRSEGGLYSQVAKLGVSIPELVFEYNYFKTNPELFYSVGNMLLSDGIRPTYVHYFIRLLHERGQLLRCFTQNIDGLESIAGVPRKKLVFAHGTISTGKCTVCEEVFDKSFFLLHFENKTVAHCPKCDGLAKPDIIFFGENLPIDFMIRAEIDMPACELLFVMGTSLKVYPFASLVHRTNAPRVLINREVVGPFASPNQTDIIALGNCDDIIRDLARMIGIDEQLEAMIVNSDTRSI